MFMKRTIILTMMLCNLVSAFAYDFEVDGIYYNITSESSLTVEVTYKSKSYHYPTSYNACLYTGSITIPETVFSNGKTYTVTGIGAWAFGTISGIDDFVPNMHNLKSISLPSTIEYIANTAFHCCIDLTHIILPDNLEKIGDYAFNECSIVSMIIPARVNNIGNAALPKSVKTLIMLPYTPPTGSTLNYGATNAEVLVPTKKMYSNDDIWKSYNIIEVISPTSYEFEYNGQVPNINWTNNLSTYTMNVSDVHLEKNAGNHSANIKANFYRDIDMSSFIVEFPYEYTINKAKLNVRANNASRVYGDDNPSFNIIYSGFVNSENEGEISTIPTISTSATKKSNVGEYPITVSGGSAKNYEFVYESGILKIIKAQLSAKVNDATKVYGEKNPSFSIDFSGLKNGETTPAWTTSPTFQTDATQSSGVGNYDVKAANGIPVNYDLEEITTGTLSVTPAPLTIKANDATRLYYSEEPNFGFICNGFVNGEKENVLSPMPTLVTTASKSSNVGTYPIKASGASNSNYTISYLDGTLTITPRTLYASVGNYERIYNEDNPAFDVKYDGFVGNEDETVLITKATASTVATKSSDVGSYPINVTGGSADNYKFSYTSGTLTINKAEQTISWEQNLSNLKVGDQVELQAVASSGLPITCSMESNSFAEIYSAGNNKKYLDCKAEGHFTIRASQDGNKNYYSSTRINKTVTIGNGESAVKSLNNASLKIQRMPFGIRVLDAKFGDEIRIYSADGVLQRTEKVEGEITDIRLSNGSVYIVKVGTRTMKFGL